MSYRVGDRVVFPRYGRDKRGTITSLYFSSTLRCKAAFVSFDYRPEAHQAIALSALERVPIIERLAELGRRA